MVIVSGDLEEGKKCQKYLTEIIGSFDEDKLFLWSQKYKLVVKSPEIFHQIAQAINQTTLRNLGGLNFTIYVPRERTIPQYWIVVLDAEDTRTFLSKYGSLYTIK